MAIPIRLGAVIGVVRELGKTEDPRPLLVVWRGLRIITVARDPFSAIVAGGIVVAFLFQVYVNVGMTMGIAPITGIPLPFISVGGSSMIANLAAMGVLLSIHARGTPFRRR